MGSVRLRILCSTTIHTAAISAPEYCNVELQDDVELDAEISSVQELALIRIKLNYEGLNGPGDIGPDYISPECRIKHSI
jgi:hypothetical protein